MPRMLHSLKGFTLLEILVAVTISITISGVALYSFSRLEYYRRIQDRQIRYAGEAEAFFAILERELGAVYSYGGNQSYPTFEITAPGAPVVGEKMTFVSAIDTLPETDHAQIAYYVDGNGLHREVTSPGVSFPPGSSSVFIPDAKSLSIMTDPDPVPPGALPAQILVTITLPDAVEWNDAAANVTWSHYFKVENAAP